MYYINETHKQNFSKLLSMHNYNQFWDFQLCSYLTAIPEAYELAKEHFSDSHPLGWYMDKLMGKAQLNIPFELEQLILAVTDFMGYHFKTRKHYTVPEYISINMLLQQYWTDEFFNVYKQALIMTREPIIRKFSFS